MKFIKVMGVVVASFVAIGVVGSMLPNQKPVPAAGDPAVTTLPLPPPTEPPTTVDSMLARMQAWNAAYQPTVQQLATTMGQVGDDATSYDVAALGTDCGRLAAEVQSLQRHPVPADSVNRPFSQALQHYATGANECERGANAFDMDLITSASEEFSTGNTFLEQATTALGAYTS